MYPCNLARALIVRTHKARPSYGFWGTGVKDIYFSGTGNKCQLLREIGSKYTIREKRIYACKLTLKWL